MTRLPHIALEAAMTDLAALLRKLGACQDAIAWAAGRDCDEAAWHACERGDWLLWLAAKLTVPRPLVVLAGCDCARLALPFVPADEGRPLRAIETAEAWALGDRSVDLQDCRAAANATAAAAYTAYATSAAYATAAAYTAYATAAAHAAAYATSAAFAAAAFAAAVMHRRCANAVRSRIMWGDVEPALVKWRAAR